MGARPRGLEARELAASASCARRRGMGAKFPLETFLLSWFSGTRLSGKLAGPGIWPTAAPHRSGRWRPVWKSSWDGEGRAGVSDRRSPGAAGPGHSCLLRRPRCRLLPKCCPDGVRGKRPLRYQGARARGTGRGRRPTHLWAPGPPALRWGRGIQGALGHRGGRWSLGAPGGLGALLAQAARRIRAPEASSGERPTARFVLGKQRCERLLQSRMSHSGRPSPHWLRGRGPGAATFVRGPGGEAQASVGSPRGQETATQSLSAARAQGSVPAGVSSDRHLGTPPPTPRTRPVLNPGGREPRRCRRDHPEAYRLLGLPGAPLGGRRLGCGRREACGRPAGRGALTAEHPPAQLPDVLLAGFSPLKFTPRVRQQTGAGGRSSTCPARPPPRCHRTLPSRTERPTGTPGFPVMPGTPWTPGKPTGPGGPGRPSTPLVPLGPWMPLGPSSPRLPA